MMINARERKFYGSGAWKRTAAQALLFHGEWCCACGATEDLEVDHIEPIRERWAARLLMTNLQVLCSACHTRKHQMEKAA